MKLMGSGEWGVIKSMVYERICSTCCSTVPCTVLVQLNTWFLTLFFCFDETVMQITAAFLVLVVAALLQH